MSKSDTFKDFWSKRPSLNQSRFAKEAQVGRQTLTDILNGAEPSPATWQKLLPVMRKYGH